MFSFLKKNKDKTKAKTKPKVKGLISVFNLENFWLNELTEEQRNEIRDNFAVGFVTKNSLDVDDIKETTESKQSFLLRLANATNDIKLKERLVKEVGINFDKFDVQERHFILMSKWRTLKTMVKEDSSFYPKLIKTLIEDCDIHDEFVVAYHKEWGHTVNYPAFKELALAYERLGQIEKAINISKEAIEKNVQENTSFENRIKQLEKNYSEFCKGK